jgi:hypothetical protein
MAQPIIPVNLGLQAEAVAGNQAATFTATDRKLIEELGGTIEKRGDFKALFLRRDLTSKVENEQTTVRQEQDITALEERKREHERMLKNATITKPRDQAEIHSAAIPTSGISHGPAEPKPVLTNQEKTGPPPELNKETAKLAKELNLDPAELYDKFAVEQNELHNLIYKIKELHLKRLLSGTSEEFAALSAEIKKESLSSVRPEAERWLSSQLDNLTRGAAEYKLKLFKSLDSIGLNPHQEKLAKWLEKLVARLT